MYRFASEKSNTNLDTLYISKAMARRRRDMSRRRRRQCTHSKTSAGMSATAASRRTRMSMALLM